MSLNRFPFCVRNIPTANQEVFLTFDDGPDETMTPALLEQLEKIGIKVTFFVIGKKALNHPALISQMIKQGHSIGDHSWDHKFGNFFSSREKILHWIKHGHRELSSLVTGPLLGFRSPAGVITPPLLHALNELSLPLIHWNRRYFDTRFVFSSERARRASARIKSGDIILLHDGNSADPKITLNAIGELTTRLKDRGLTLAALNQDMI